MNQSVCDSMMSYNGAGMIKVAISETLRHIVNLDLRVNCECCKGRTWYRAIDHRKVICAINRSRNRNGRCTLRITEYFLTKYDVYECTNCGAHRFFHSGRKRISKQEAEQSGLKIVSNLRYWMEIHANKRGSSDMKKRFLW